MVRSAELSRSAMAANGEVRSPVAWASVYTHRPSWMSPVKSSVIVGSAEGLGSITAVAVGGTTGGGAVGSIVGANVTAGGGGVTVAGAAVSLGATPTAGDGPQLATTSAAIRTSEAQRDLVSFNTSGEHTRSLRFRPPCWPAHGNHV